MAKAKPIKGLDQLLKQFKALKAEGPEIARKAGLAGGLVIQELAVMKVPKVSGTLSRSITIEVEVSGTKILVRIGTNLSYALRIEFGFKGTDSLGRSFNQAAQPYMRPAFDQGKAKALSDIKAALVAQLNKL